MPIQPTQMFRGPAPTTNTQIFTVPTGQTAVVTEVVVTNPTNNLLTYSITLDGQALASGLAIPAHATQVINLHQVLLAGCKIAVSSASSGLTIHISGVTYT